MKGQTGFHILTTNHINVGIVFDIGLIIYLSIYHNNDNTTRQSRTFLYLYTYNNISECLIYLSDPDFLHRKWSFARELEMYPNTPQYQIPKSKDITTNKSVQSRIKASLLSSSCFQPIDYPTWKPLPAAESCNLLPHLQWPTIQVIHSVLETQAVCCCHQCHVLLHRSDTFTQDNAVTVSFECQSVEGNTAAIDSGKNLMIYFQLFRQVLPSAGLDSLLLPACLVSRLAAVLQTQALLPIWTSNFLL